MKLVVWRMFAAAGQPWGDLATSSYSMASPHGGMHIGLAIISVFLPIFCADLTLAFSFSQADI